MSYLIGVVKKNVSETSFFGLQNIKLANPIKDTLISKDGSSYNLYYAKLIGKVIFYEEESDIEIEVFANKRYDAIEVMRKIDDEENASLINIQNRYLVFTTNNLFFRMTLQKKIQQSSIYLLNLKSLCQGAYIQYLSSKNLNNLSVKV